MMGNVQEFRNYLLLILILGASVLGAVAARTVWVDPYWLWRQQPQWVQQHGGHNRVLDQRMRHAKALQVVTRKPETVILGSSRVYRGFDTTCGLAGGMYNMGISSLRIAEARQYVQHLVKYTPIRRLILGLEYFMFDAEETIIDGFDLDTGSSKYLLTAFPTALITTQAWDDARIAQRGLHGGDGQWRRSGFKTTRERDARDLEKISKSYQKHQISGRQYEQLSLLMETAGAADLDFQVYLSPMSKTYLQSLVELGEAEKFQAWRKRVAAIAKQQGVSFHDFSTSTEFSNEIITDHSTESWIDGSHFQPAVGQWILKELLLAEKPCPPLQ